MKTNRKNPVIDFEKLGGRVYVGRPAGVLARKHFKIEEYENQENFPIEVHFPENARTLTSSFFLGMFGNSVRTAGSRDNFLKRFIFKANKQILAEVNAGIDEALSAA
jgi:hypothetical protein